MQFMYRHGYALPENVKREPRVPRGGTYTTEWSPRGTYDAGAPGFSLGTDDAAADPISDFGVAVSRTVMRNLAKVPQSERASALETLFGRLDPMLYPRIKRERAKLERQGHTPDRALRSAIAMAASQGLVEQFQRAGSGVLRPAAMGFFNPASWVAKGVKGLGSTGSFLKNTAGQIAGLACRVAGTDAGALAAGAAGGPAAAGGAKAVGQFCSPKQQAAIVQQQRQFPILPIALIAAGTVAAIVLIK